MKGGKERGLERGFMEGRAIHRLLVEEEKDAALERGDGRIEYWDEMIIMHRGGR